MKGYKKALFGLSTSSLLLILVEGSLRLSPLEASLTTDTPVRQDAIIAYQTLHTPALQLTRDREATVPPHAQIYTTPFPRYIPSRVAMPKPADTFRVLIVGDSVAWGFLDGEDAFRHNSLDKQRQVTITGQLQRLLGEVLAPRKVEVINLGLPGTVSEFSLARAEEGLAYELDLVVVYTGLNDKNLALYRAATDPAFRARGWIRRHLRLAELLWRTMQRPTHTVSSSAEDQARAAGRMQATVQNLAALVALGQKRGVPVLIGLPITAYQEAAVEMRRNLRRALPPIGGLLVDIEAQLKGVARAEGIPFPSLFSADQVHPTPKGYAEFAAAYVKAFQEYGLARPRSPAAGPGGADGR